MQTDGGSPGSGLAMYDDEAAWFHLLTAPADYAGEAAFIRDLFLERAAGSMETLLELGSGGGNTASHLKAHFRLTLTDLAPAMLALSRGLNPEAEHVAGDMRTIRLGREFDGVLIHDAIMYMATEADLRAALETARVHCRPGGVGVFVPDCIGETFQPRTSHGGHDGSDRALRYLEWAYDPDPDDPSYVSDFAILFREGTADVRVRFDRHVMGLFARAEWLRLLDQAGFQASTVTDPDGRVVFTGVRVR
jgi:methyltransferase family protein